MFRNIKNRLKSLESAIGKPKACGSSFFDFYLMNSFFGGRREKTLFERVEALEDKLAKIEEYLKISYVEENKEFKGYKAIKK